MTLALIGNISLPEHKGRDGFDHAAAHAASGNIYVAHTAFAPGPDQSVRIIDVARGPNGLAHDARRHNRWRQHLYVAIGDPGAIDIFATATMERLAAIETEAGAHTTALSSDGKLLCAFLPRTHRAAIYRT